MHAVRLSDQITNTVIWGGVGEAGGFMKNNYFLVFFSYIL